VLGFGSIDEFGGDAVLVSKVGFLFGGGWLWSVLGHEDYGVWGLGSNEC
jgi:hypothetical protein